MSVRMNLGDGKERVEVRFALRIVTRWYTQQVVFKFRNDTDDVIITFRCNKGTFEVQPHKQWEHPFILGASAAEMMNTVEITRAVRNGLRLSNEECELVLTEQSVCYWALNCDKKTNKKQATGSESEGTNWPKLGVGVVASAMAG